MVRQLNDSIFSIDVPLPGSPLRNINSFLVKGNSRSLLIDTGFNMPESLAALRNGLDELGVDIDETDILITHLHSDHMGLAPSIAGGGTGIFMSRIDLDIFRKISEPEYIAVRDENYLSYGFTRDELLKNKKLNPARIYLPDRDITYIPIEDGHVFNLGNCRLECVMTPGHTPGHLCLYDRDRRLFFSGDHILFGISPNIISWNQMPDSLGSYIESLEKIKLLDIEHTFAAHRQIEGDIKKRIGELIRHHMYRLNEAESIVSSRGTSTVCDVASEMKWSIRVSRWESFPVAQKWFAVGETHAHLEYLKIRRRLNSRMENGMLYYSVV